MSETEIRGVGGIDANLAGDYFYRWATHYYKSEQVAISERASRIYESQGFVYFKPECARTRYRVSPRNSRMVARSPAMTAYALGRMCKRIKPCRPS